jgi:hypothetical protein
VQARRIGQLRLGVLLIVMFVGIWHVLKRPAERGRD